jgi:hypothetical protein
VTKDPCGYPLWIAKVMKVNKENEEVIAIEVHWYASISNKEKKC